jgi:hypothetical protein
MVMNESRDRPETQKYRAKSVLSVSSASSVAWMNQHRALAQTFHQRFPGGAEWRLTTHPVIGPRNVKK